MLAMLRQMYYGKPWSATSQTDLWDNVIPCSLALGNPEAILGPTLFAALHASAEVDGVDVGHVFTGLESMICPSPNVSMMGGVAVIGTPNEDFATWAGDLGASAASHVVCPMLGADAATNEDCFTLVGAHPLADYRNGQAPPQDMEGDIDAFVLRAASMGIPCTGSARRPLTITRPISELFLDYYNAPDSPLGTAHENRYRCFLEALGARLSGNRITNQAAIEPGLIRRVAEFAYAFYAKVWGGAFRGGVLHASDGADRRQMDIDSAELVRWFLHDLESRL
jgi:hypothetical protein